MEELLRLEDPKKQQLVRIYPKYVRLRQGSDIRYRLKLTRPPTKSVAMKGKAVTIHVKVIMNKSGITALPTHLVVTSKDWRQTREVTVRSSEESDLRTFQIHHKIHETYDEVYNTTTLLPSLFVSVLQKEATFLFGFGCAIDGRLGTNGETNTSVPTPFSCRWLHPLQIACGKAHSAVVDVYSNLYCFGLGAHGQLGQGEDSIESSQEPLRVPQLTSTCVQHVACGSNHTLCLSVDGRVFAWGDNTFGQLGLGSRGAEPVTTPYRVEKTTVVRGIACGGGQSFILTKTSVLACGSNIAGQLGLGDRVNRASFEAIPFFRNAYTAIDPLEEESEPVVVATDEEASPEDVALACGFYHTLALSGGQVYSWGIGDDGRLGHGDHDIRLVPTLVNALKDYPVSAVGCGGSHSGCVASSGDVFTWGNGSLGQLGLGKTRSRCVPTRVRLLQDKGVTQLAFGEWHSMALCQNGTLFAWGFGEEGQLGLPDTDLEPTRRVALFPVAVHALSGTGATLVASGGSHTFVVTVQENRRQQLAQLHRRASQLNIREEEERLATLERRLSRRLSVKDQRSSDKAIPIVREADKMKTQEKGIPRAKCQSSPSMAARKCNSARRAEGPWSQPSSAAAAESFAWKSRPLSSRLSVRNAFRQQNRDLEEWRDSMAPPDVLPPQPRRLGISPRLLRLSKQIGRRKAPENHQTTQAITDAVNAATESCLRLGSMGFCMESNCSALRSPTQVSIQHDQREDALDLLEIGRGLHMASTSTIAKSFSDGEKEEDDEIALYGGSNKFGGCQALEADIRSTLGPIHSSLVSYT